MSALLEDVRFGLRKAARNPSLFGVIVLSLALGVGANAAFFAFFQVLLGRPLPVPQPDQLVLFFWEGERSPIGMHHSGDSQPRSARSPVASRSFPLSFVERLRGRSELFDSVFAFAPLGFGRHDVTLVADGEAVRVDGEMVTGQYFSGLRVPMSHGRGITSEDEATRAPVVVISSTCWSTRFSSRPDVVGASVTLNGTPFTVVGVAPRGFFGTEPGRSPDFWIPVMDIPSLPAWGARPDVPDTLVDSSYWWLKTMARLRAGVDRERAHIAITSELQQHVADVMPQTGGDLLRLGMDSGRSGVDVSRRTYERPLLLLLAASAAALLVAAANVAVLLLAYTLGRRGELAMRLALGASRARVVRQLLTESLAVGLAAAALSVICAAWFQRALLSLIPATVRPAIERSMDWTVVLFCTVLAVGGSVVIAVVPALLVRGMHAMTVLRTAGVWTTSGTRSHERWSGMLIAAQVSVSLALTLAAALFVRSLVNLRAEPLGIQPEGLLVFGLDGTQAGLTGDRLLEEYKDVLHAVQSVPNVQSATVARLKLFSGSISLAPISQAGADAGSRRPGQWNAVGPAFASTMGMRLIAGRDLEWGDFGKEHRVAIVSEVVAADLFGQGNPVGASVIVGDPADPRSRYEIVGVVSKAKYGSVRADFPRIVYVPFTAAPAGVRGLVFHVRSSGPPLLATAIGDAVRRVNPRLALAEVQTMGQQVEDSLWRDRLLANLTSSFSGAALVLACIGVYASQSYSVARRRSEIAIRLALGAPRARLVLSTVGVALIPTTAGLILGAPLALWVARFVSASLFQIAPWDALTLAAVPSVLLMTAGVAVFLPARRATLVEPASVLKLP